MLKQLLSGGLLVGAFALLPGSPGFSVAAPQYDVVVYGGTSAGVVTAVQVAHMNKSVLLIEPGQHVGGLTSGGLGATDIGNKAAIGGLSRMFYRQVGAYYARNEAWTFQKRESYRTRRQAVNDKEMWTFEPHVAEMIFQRMLSQANVPVIYGERLDLDNGVIKQGARLASISMESGLKVQAEMFIDATYEGDLMATAGVSYHVGRESNATYGETLNGVQTRNAQHHQFIKAVDPYIVPDNPASGLLPGITQPGGAGQEGAGDHRVQAYCFRMCTTDVPRNRRPWTKPINYDPVKYELLLRNLEAGDHRICWHPVWMPNRKTDTNNNYAISTDNIGMNYDYPEGDYATRVGIVKEHISYQQGLMWTLAHHPRVPAHVRKHFQRLGLAKDEFIDNDNWPHQLYIREARRMVSDHVMTQHDCQGRRIAKDSVGLAAYTMDSHNVQRHVTNGRVLNEGDVQVAGFSPYPIAYRSIRPKQSECTNLLVPVCLSASHIAYGSIRMEPVFMVLGQSAATAACQAIDSQVAVQQIDISKFQQRLLADQQVLEWTGPKRIPPLEPQLLPGIVVDELAAELTGNWLRSRSVDKYVAEGYLHDANVEKGKTKAVFRPIFKKAGRYQVLIAYTPNPNRASNVPVTVQSADGKRLFLVNQKKVPSNGTFHLLGVMRFHAGRSGSVTITTNGTDGYVIVDAVQFLSVAD